MRGFSEQLHAAAKKTTPGFETTSTCDVGVRLNYMKQVGPALLQVIHIKNKMQETVGVVSRASALVIPPFCKLSQPYSVGLGSTRRWTSAVLGARSRASTLLVASDAGRNPTVGDFSRQHRATRPKGCGASWERGWVLSFRHTLSNLGQQTCKLFAVEIDVWGDHDPARTSCISSSQIITHGNSIQYHLKFSYRVRGCSLQPLMC